MFALLGIPNRLYTLPTCLPSRTLPAMLTYIFVVLSAAAPMTPSELQKLMGVGINLGNTLEAPIEGQWAPRAQESFFDEFKRIGFQV